MKTNEPVFLNEEEVRKHLRMADLIPAMDKALIAFSAGKVTQPVRSVIKIDPPGGFFGGYEGLGIDGYFKLAAERNFIVFHTHRRLPGRGCNVCFV